MPEFALPGSPSVSERAAGLSLLLEKQSRKALRLTPGFGLDQLQRRTVGRRQAMLNRAGIGMLADGENGFPDLLADIPDAPLALYLRGDPAALQGTAIAIVGARRASRTGQELARVLAAELAGAGVVIISGLALGVDAAAHQGALDAGGRTIAVLGSGPEQITPLANTRLGERILGNAGLLLSEYPPGTPAAPFRFPERNRLISGLSLGVVVVEADERSGSLITARLAAEQGREVMAVPGVPGYPNSTGTNRLLKTGAVLVERAEDVLHAIGAYGGPGRPIPNPPNVEKLTMEQRKLLDLLDGQARNLDELAGAVSEPVSACAIAMTELELEGFVQRVSGGYIRRPSEF